MLAKLKHILNTFADKGLEEMELWVNSTFQVDKILIDEFSIDLIGRNISLVAKTEDEIYKDLKEKRGE